MTIFAHRLLSFVWRQQNNRKGLTPANGISPNLYQLKIFIGQQYYSYESSTYYQLPRQELLNKFIAISGYSGGFSLSAAKSIYGDDFDSSYSTILNFLINENLATIKDERLQLTETGFRHYGAALSLFF